MLNSLLINASILISLLYLGSQLFTDKKIDSRVEFKTKLLIGILFGISGCLLMFNGIDLSNHIILDLRIVAIIISAIYCGSVSAFITTIIIIAFRILYFGLTAASVTAVFNLTVLFIVFSIISIAKFNFKKKYLFMSVANILSSTIWTYILVKDTRLVLSIVYKYIFLTITVSIVIYFMLVYIFKTNELYLQLKRESSKDFLTGLYNVRQFERLFNELLITVANKNIDLSLLMIDIDHFKNVNDTHGHSSGDMVLKQLSSVITNSCRSFDIVSRKGGEEFVIILLGSNYGQACEIGEKIRENVENFNFIIDSNQHINITVSIGVSSYPDRTIDPSHLIQEADNALYFAKRNGRNQVK